MKLSSYVYGALLLLLGCDSAPGVESAIAIELSTYDDVVFEIGRQSIKVQTGNQHNRGRWEAGSESPDLWAATFALIDFWLAGIQDGVVRANLARPRGNNLTFSPVIADSQDAPIYLVRRSHLRGVISNWPIDLGAPIDKLGKPIMYGDAMTWYAMFSATEGAFVYPPAHGFDGLRVSQAVYGFDDPDFKDVYFIRYDISNVSGSDVEAMHIGFSTATLLTVKHSAGSCEAHSTGFDLHRKISYTYINSDGYPDVCYGVVSGFSFVDATVSTGEKIETGSHRIYRKNNSFVPGFGERDLVGSDQIFNALQGLSADGQPMLDPTTGEETKWAFTGDPVSGTGWLDRVLFSARSLMSTEAFNLAANESVSITIAMMTVSGQDLERGIESIRSLSDEIRVSFELWSTPRR